MNIQMSQKILVPTQKSRKVAQSLLSFQKGKKLERWQMEMLLTNITWSPTSVTRKNRQMSIKVAQKLISLEKW